MASHNKSPMEHYVCMEDQSYRDKHDVCTSYGTLHAATCTCTMCSQRRIYREPVTWELHMHGELPKEYNFIYIYKMSKHFASGTKLSGRSNKNKEKFSKGYAKWERVM